MMKNNTIILVLVIRREMGCTFGYYNKALNTSIKGKLPEVVNMAYDTRLGSLLSWRWDLGSIRSM